VIKGELRYVVVVVVGAMYVSVRVMDGINADSVMVSYSGGMVMVGGDTVVVV
jgi:hypothetical protein